MQKCPPWRDRAPFRRVAFRSRCRLRLDSSQRAGELNVGYALDLHISGKKVFFMEALSSAHFELPRDGASANRYAQYPSTVIAS